jgi:hypothetical protein
LDQRVIPHARGHSQDTAVKLAHLLNEAACDEHATTALEIMRAHSFLAVLTFCFMQPVAAQEPILSVRNNTEQKELIFELGPLHLGAGGDHGEIAQPRAQAIALPISGHLHGFTAEMIDASGNAIPLVLLHHVNIIAPQRRELFSQIMQRVGAAGSETGPVVFPKVVGYPVVSGDSLLFTAMFHNPTNTSYHGARLRIHMRYSVENNWYPLWAIQPFYLDVMPPAGVHAYDLPPGRSERSWEGKPAIGGRILALGGHLHKYAVALRLENVTEGKVLFETAPEVDKDGNVIGMPRKNYVWKLGIPLRPDHTYKLTAIYDNPTGQTLVGGGMGALGGVLVPDRDPWPAVDRNDPEYLLDVKVTYQGAHGRGHGAHGAH